MKNLKNTSKEDDKRNLNKIVKNEFTFGSNASSIDKKNKSMHKKSKSPSRDFGPSITKPNEKMLTPDTDNILLPLSKSRSATNMLTEALKQAQKQTGQDFQ